MAKGSSTILSKNWADTSRVVSRLDVSSRLSHQRITSHGGKQFITLDSTHQGLVVNNHAPNEAPNMLATSSARHGRQSQESLQHGLLSAVDTWRTMPRGFNDIVLYIIQLQAASHIEGTRKVWLRTPTQSLVPSWNILLAAACRPLHR